MIAWRSWTVSILSLRLIAARPCVRTTRKVRGGWVRTSHGHGHTSHVIARGQAGGRLSHSVPVMLYTQCIFALLFQLSLTLFFVHPSIVVPGQGMRIVRTVGTIRLLTLRHSSQVITHQGWIQVRTGMLDMVCVLYCDYSIILEYSFTVCRRYGNYFGFGVVGSSVRRSHRQWQCASPATPRRTAVRLPLPTSSVRPHRAPASRRGRP